MKSIELIREFLHERLEIEAERITPDAVLAELGVDSLTMLELIFEFEDRYKIDMPEDTPFPKTVGELITLMEGIIANNQAAS